MELIPQAIIVITAVLCIANLIEGAIKRHYQKQSTARKVAEAKNRSKKRRELSGKDDPINFE